MPLPFANPHTQADLQQLQCLLLPLLQAHFSEPPKQLRLLNMACGRADETGILADLLYQICPQTEITGIDIRKREIDEANTRWSSMPCVPARFYVQDASQISHVRGLDGPYDIIMMRHQNFWNGAEVWHRIYDNALHRLSEQGVLVITSYFDREHIQASKAISAMGGRLVASVQNPRSRPIPDAPNKSVDRHIALFTQDNADAELLIS